MVHDCCPGQAWEHHCHSGLASQAAERDIEYRHARGPSDDVAHGSRSFLGDLDNSDIQKELEEVRSRKQSLIEELEEESIADVAANNVLT